MKTKVVLSACIAPALLATVSIQLPAAPLGTVFTYQGRLNDGAGPANGSYDLRFTLFDAESGGIQIGSLQYTNAVAVSNGLFAVKLDFGAAFTGDARWLSIAVKTNGAEAYTPLTPRQGLTPSPYALYSLSAGTAAITANATAVAANGVANASIQSNAVSSDKITDGTLTAADLSPALASNTFWRLGGNAGTTPGTHFLGTTDDQPVELRVKSARALRLESTTNAPNVIGGYDGNRTGAGVYGATIFGGRPGGPNIVNAAIAGVSGGENNTIQKDATFSVISGGTGNSVGTNALTSTIAGGSQNGIQANTWGSSIGGGAFNTNAGLFATVPGGDHNRAAGSYAFAAGHRAKANHNGTFVWADSTDTDFASSQMNQFLIRASGGVGIGKNNPVTALDVNGSVTATAFAGSGAGLTDVNASQLSGTVPDGLLSANVALRAGGNAFTGKQTVTQTTGGSLTYPLKIANKGETVGTSVGMLFQADSDLGDDRGKGALVYERKDTWNRGSFHFLQNSLASSTIAGLSNAVMTIANNGNVGLRTTSPQAALDINSGDSIFTGIDLNNTTTPAGSNGYRLQVVGSGVSGRQGNLEIWKKGGNNLLTAQPEGNLGIGTTSPQASLDINKSSGQASIRLTSGGSWPLVLNQSATSDFTITNGNQARVTVQGDGDVGIGTSSPQAKLHVVGNARIDGTLAYAGLGGLNFGQSNTGIDIAAGATNTLQEFGVLKPAAGFLVIMATANVRIHEAFDLYLFDITDGKRYLTDCRGSGALNTLAYAWVTQTLQLNWVVPVSAGGYINLRLEGTALGAEAEVWGSSMVVMFFPSRLN